MVQRLRLCAPTAEDAGSISGRGTRTLHVSNAAKEEKERLHKTLMHVNTQESSLALTDALGTMSKL